MEKKNRAAKIMRIIMPIVAIISAIIFVPWDIVGSWIMPLPPTVQQQVENAVKGDLDGIIVYVDQAGEEPAFYAAGWKDKINEIPADPHSLFKVASISKLYIAAAAAKLVNDGSLSLETTLADYLPEYVGRIENADQITLRMLLQHRSGIPNFTDAAGWDWFASHKENDQALKLVLDTPANFAPNARYQYSNTNYLLIGKILDNVLGYSHEEFILNEIVAPLGLTNTYSFLSDVAIQDVASGYWVEYDDDLRYFEYRIPGGSMVATAEDVGIFLRALNDGSLLTANEQAIYSSIYDYEHTGWLPGYYSIARYHPDLDAVVIQFVSNTGGNSISISNIVYNRIVRILQRQ
ncbi:MAG: serine hydrolase domain-containing protein [Anaerolineae bacterium]|jgi:CubicO group peptidase (beta-lactamase class C family)|nr:serine hydrolase domain-containing protein [Anaerolineae bacterium]